MLPDGFDRELNSPFESTHLLNSSEPVEQAAELLGCQFQVRTCSKRQLWPVCCADKTVGAQVFDPYMSQILG